MIKEAMQQRYAVKQYSDQKLPEGKIQMLKDILRLSPSSVNSQPWQFVFVENQEEKEKFAAASMSSNESKIKNASCLIIFRSKTVDFFEQDMKNYLPEAAINYYKNSLKPLEKHEIQSWIDQQVYIALGVLLTSCAAENIDATPMEGIDNEAYDKLLNDTNYHTLAAATIGIADPEDYNRLSETPKQRDKVEKVIKSIK
ncbi:Oxygen-insensitive NAD(P)H nitroreductase [Candidatus Ornithobacterium hominis]|uniref:nitroreductase family protein n=1 Tax=Candidatus Ornithobacterium hominis TaxID=2497989 RepID=UPI0024BD18F4|nr:nitroreductase family protein [Candidatus Ornithobacterium hominis]CAI9429085.1 Oxygen-insensitive NAD(P)H nitroreductase [Candidatus Ornithobacterium hominis]